jgi:hypothetical protein
MISFKEFIMLIVLVVVIDFAARISVCFYYGYLSRRVDSIETFFRAGYRFFSFRKITTAIISTILICYFFIMLRSGVVNIAFIYTSVAFYCIFGLICFTENFRSVKNYIDNR